jgi:hypothetical protein
LWGDGTALAGLGIAV